MARPNLFEYATSELSQDAVLCWLAAWAKPEAAAEDRQLHELGIQYIAALLDVHKRPVPEITCLEVRRQYKNIDVLLVINEQIAICIEDKAGSTDHSNQLARYIDVLVRQEGFKTEDIVPIYVQTFEQDTYAAVNAAGYKVIPRKTLLSILESYATSPDANAIARDFYKRLMDIDREVKSFLNQPLDQWKWLAWQGFYCELQARLLAGEWGYVWNPNGGFQGYWWHANKTPGCEQYLQLEEGKLCFKISVEKSEDRTTLRDRWNMRLLEEGRTLGLNVARPNRFRLGQTMTVAVVQDYRVANERGHLDIDATIARLKKAEAVLDAAVRNILL